MMNTRWWICCAVVLTACVRPGDLDNKEEFERLLLGDGGVIDGGARAGSGGRQRRNDRERSRQRRIGRAHAGLSRSVRPDQEPLRDGRLPRRDEPRGHARPRIAEHRDAAREQDGHDDRLHDEEAVRRRTSRKRACIYGKLLNPPACGTLRMPVGLPLKDDEIACMMRWISNPVCGSANGGAGGARAGAGGSRAGAGGMGGARAGAGGMTPMPSGSTIWIEAEDGDDHAAVRGRGRR